jgi:hypothetical protein
MLLLFQKKPISKYELIICPVHNNLCRKTAPSFVTGITHQENIQVEIPANRRRRRQKTQAGFPQFSTLSLGHHLQQLVEEQVLSQRKGKNTKIIRRLASNNVDYKRYPPIKILSARPSEAGL